ncbi:MAG: hypothetical protein ABFS02_07600 [Pseudomonadota bacterium]
MGSIKHLRHFSFIATVLLIAIAVLGATAPAQARREGEDRISGKRFEVSGLRHLKVSRCCKARDSDYDLFFAFDASVKNWEAYATEQDLLDGVNHVMSGTYQPNGRAGRRYELFIDPSGVNDFLEAVIKPWALENLQNPDEVDDGDQVNLTVRKAKMKLNVTLKRSSDDIKAVKIKGSFKLRRRPKDLEDAGRKGSGIFRLKLKGGELPPL